MKTTLVILAAGMSHRYGSLKQIESFGPNGETILDYSIYDALEAGFTEIILIIQKKDSQKFQKFIHKNWDSKVTIKFCYQEFNSFTDNFTIDPSRVKPWGTGHAVLCLKDMIENPFCVINADDFYGKDAFKRAKEFLKDANENQYGNIYFYLEKTISLFGDVTRGVCIIDSDDFLKDLVEIRKIRQINNEIINTVSNEVLDPKTKVSMNFWCFHPSIIKKLEKEFYLFLEKNQASLTEEFILPEVVCTLVKKENLKVKMLSTNSDWFGVTYKQDSENMKKNLSQLIEKKKYPLNIY